MQSAFVTLILLGTLFTAGLMAWAWIISQWRVGAPLLRYEPRRSVPWDGFDLVVILGCFIVAESVCLVIGKQWSGADLPESTEQWTSSQYLLALSADMAAKVMVLVAALTLLIGRTNASAADLGYDSHHVRDDLRCGLVAFVATAPIVYGIQALLQLLVKYQHTVIDAMGKEPEFATLAVITLSAVVVAPVFEEFVFRVVLQGWLEKIEVAWLRHQNSATSISADNQNACADFPTSVQAVSDHGDRGAFGLSLGFLPILTSSVLFALVHWGDGAAPVPLFVLALVLGYLYQRTHRIIPSLVVHAMLNAVSVAMLIFATDH